MRKRTSRLSFLILILCLFLGVLVFATSGSLAYAQEKHAVIKAVSITSKIYVADTFTFDVTAGNIDAGWFGADLFFVAYWDNQYWFTSPTQYVWRATEYTWRYQPSSSVAGVHEAYVVLYWKDGSTNRLQDVSSKVSTKVVKLSATLSDESISVERGYRTPLTWLVKTTNTGNDDMYDAAVSVMDSKGLAITPNSQQVGGLASGSSKTLSFSVTAPSGINTDYYSVAFTISYKSFDGKSLSNLAPAKVNVIPISTAIEVSVPGSARVGETILVSGKLKDHNGDPVPSQQITFSMDSISLGSAVTDSSGIASLTYGLSLPAGTYTIKATYQGSSWYGSSTGSSKFLISELQLTIITQIANARIISVTLDGATTYYTTDASGKVIIAISKKGTYTLTVISPFLIDSNTRVVFVKWLDEVTSNTRTVVMDKDQTFTAILKKQYYLAVNSLYGSPSGSGWYDVGATVKFSVNTLIDHQNSTRRVFIRWLGDSTATTPETTIVMNSPLSVTAAWKTQYYLTTRANPDVGIPEGAGWQDVGSMVAVSASPMISKDSGTRYVFISWSGEVSGTENRVTIVMSSPRIVIANYKTQHYLKVNSPYSDPKGSGWYDAGGTSTFAVTSPDEKGNVRAVVTGYTGDASGSGSSGSVLMNSPKEVTFQWKTQYYLALDNGGRGVVAGGGWYDSGTRTSFSIGGSPEVAEAGTRYVFVGWIGSGEGVYKGNETIYAVTMNNPITQTAQWKKQHLISLEFTDSTDSRSILPSQIALLNVKGSKAQFTKFSDVWIDADTYTIAEVLWSGLDVRSDAISLKVDRPQTFRIKTNIYDARIKITDPLNLPVAGAAITATLANRTTITAQTDNQGVALIMAIPLGRYNATLTYLGQTLKISGDASREPTATSTLTFSLPVIGTIAVVLVCGLVLTLRARHKGGTRPSKPSKQIISSRGERSLTALDLEKEKVITMLNELEEKYRKGEIDEETYTRLKTKYRTQLDELTRQTER